MSPPTRAHRGDGVTQVRSILLAALSVEVAVLVITGIALYFVYVPTGSQAWSDVFPAGRGAGVRLADAIRLLHRLAAVLAVSTALATCIVLALRGRPDVRRWTGSVLGVGIVLTTVAVSVTGYLLPWDQLALWAVTVGTDIKGYRWLANDSVRFVLMGGVEVDKATVLRWLEIHVLVLTPVLIGLVALAWRRLRATPG
ncbi:MAG: menaquinol-cytochrome c reductase cytochrome b subunit [Actinomycetota bacterium]|nr:menaquinol-cytochrome c reductase cytochrome b subunit [Actinomycetota bacterium]